MVLTGESRQGVRGEGTVDPGQSGLDVAAGGKQSHKQEEFSGERKSSNAEQKH